MKGCRFLKIGKRNHKRIITWHLGNYARHLQHPPLSSKSKLLQRRQKGRNTKGYGFNLTTFYWHFHQDGQWIFYPFMHFQSPRNFAGWWSHTISQFTSWSIFSVTVSQPLSVALSYVFYFLLAFSLLLYRLYISFSFIYFNCTCILGMLWKDYWGDQAFTFERNGR